MSDKHLSQTERYQIYALKNTKQSIEVIAQVLGRHKSTISREVSRHSLRGYRPKQADLFCQQRAQSSLNGPSRNTRQLQALSFGNTGVRIELM